MMKRFTPGEIEFLKANYGTMPGKQIAARLARTVNSVREKARLLGLAERKTRYDLTSEEIEFLKAHYGTMPTRELSARLRCGQNYIYEKARMLGLTETNNDGGPSEQERAATAAQIRAEWEEFGPAHRGDGIKPRRTRAQRLAERQLKDPIEKQRERLWREYLAAPSGSPAKVRLLRKYREALESQRGDA